MDIKSSWLSILNKEIIEKINELDIREKVLENNGLKILPKHEYIFKCFTNGCRSNQS